MQVIVQCKAQRDMQAAKVLCLAVKQEGNFMLNQLVAWGLREGRKNDELSLTGLSTLHYDI